MLISSIHNREIEKRTRLHRDFGGQAKLEDSEWIKQLEEKSKLTEEEVLEAVSSEVKKRKEATLAYEKGGRQELAEKEKKEAEVLQKYLPEQLSEEEIRKIAEEAIKKVGAKEMKEMGRVMAELMSRVKGKADGAVVNKIVKEFLTRKTE